MRSSDSAAADALRFGFDCFWRAMTKGGTKGRDEDESFYQRALREWKAKANGRKSDGQSEGDLRWRSDRVLIAALPAAFSGASPVHAMPLQNLPFWPNTTVLFA